MELEKLIGFQFYPCSVKMREQLWAKTPIVVIVIVIINMTGTAWKILICKDRAFKNSYQRDLWRLFFTE